MKKLMRGLFIFVAASVILLLVGGLVLSRPSVQQSLVEGMLPEGSSIGAVQLTPKTLEFKQLALRLPDGTQLDLADLQADFHPLAALFQRKIQLGTVAVEGLNLRLPQLSVAAPVSSTPGMATVPAPASEVQPRVVPAVAEVSESVNRSTVPAVNAEPLQVRDVLAALESFEWLLEAERIDVSGELIDAAGAVYKFTLKSQSIRPGQRSELKFSAELVSGVPAFSDELGGLSCALAFYFQQNLEGGFEELSVQVQAEGSDAKGQQLLAVDQSAEFSIGATEANANINLQAELARPERLLPDLAAMGPLRLDVKLEAQSQQDRLTLSGAEIRAMVGGAPLLDLDLKQPLRVGEPLPEDTVLLTAQLKELPLSWLAPFMPEGVQISGAPLAADLQLSAAEAGGLKLQSREPLSLGPVTVVQAGQVMLQQVALQFTPVVELSPVGQIDFELRSLRLMDAVGTFGRGQLSGEFDPAAARTVSLFDGLGLAGDLQLDLVSLFQQPLLRERASLVGGQLLLDVKLDAVESAALRLQARLVDLRGSARLQQREDYQVNVELRAPVAESWAVEGRFTSGAVGETGTQVDYAAQFRLDATPLPFKLAVKGPRVRQADFDVLIAAFESPAVAPAVRPVAAPAPRVQTPTKSAVKPTLAAESRPVAPVPSPILPSPPPWAGVVGEVDVHLDRIITDYGMQLEGFKLQATVSEPSLQLQELSFGLNGGAVAGRAQVDYNSEQVEAYALNGNLKFQEMNPSRFSAAAGSPIPLQGKFNGALNVQGNGLSLEQAVDSAEFDLLIQGSEGVLTAFELEGLGQLGVGLGGILGQLIDRPGVTALSQTIPYFQNMKFEDFAIEIHRGTDQQLVIPTLKFVGENLLINGSGKVGAGSLRTLVQQPLELNLEFGAKGALINYLETLNLLGVENSADGFRMWRTGVQLRGTLAQPDSSALMDILNEAASSALMPAGSNSSVEQSPAEKSEAGKRNSDVEMGIQLLQSIFGN